MWEDYEDIETIGSEDPWFYYPDHINSDRCWCEPELEYEDPDNGNRVYVHNDTQ